MIHPQDDPPTTQQQYKVNLRTCPWPSQNEQRTVSVGGGGVNQNFNIYTVYVQIVQYVNVMLGYHETFIQYFWSK